jgi:RNA polymerase sigma factor (sigma-70 family)
MPRPGASVDDHSPTTPKEANDSGMTDDQAMSWSLGIARGDRAALGSLFDARFEWMLTQCRFMTGRDEHFALDIVQDAMLRLAKGMLPLNTAQEVDRYLRAVLRSCAIDRLRAELRRSARESRHTHQSSPSPAADREELQRLIAALSLQERDTLISRFARGMGLSTLAMLHHSTAPIMQGRLRRLLEHLRSETKL